MIDSPFPDIAVLILGFLAGFASAIWLAVALEDGARKMAEKAHDQAEK